jgi:dTDP-glucose 4,6-dehydratase
LLQSALKWWREHPGFTFQHISTDEVYGTLGPEGYFTEETPYSPHSPYSASKAASDHLVRAWHDTYGLPVLITNCSNNFGPRQFPEKLIPLCIINALEERELPVYGDGGNVRDWLYVEDHARALMAVLEGAEAGSTWLVGGNSERTNLQVVKAVCRELDVFRPRRQGNYEELIRFVADRPGHDARYAIDAEKLRRTLGWRPEVPFDEGIRRCVRWYVEHRSWWLPLREKRYGGERLGGKAHG